MSTNRETFERTVKSKWSDSYSFTRAAFGDYADEVLEGMWWAWQASAQKPSAAVPEGGKLIEVGFTPDEVAEAGVKCLHALKAAHCIDPRTVAVTVFQDMLLAYAPQPQKQEQE